MFFLSARRGLWLARVFKELIELRVLSAARMMVPQNWLQVNDLVSDAEARECLGPASSLTGWAFQVGNVVTFDELHSRNLVDLQHAFTNQG
jgi:hypothetical protein